MFANSVLLPFANAIPLLLPSHTINILQSLERSKPFFNLCCFTASSLAHYEQERSNELGKNKGRRQDFGLTYPSSDGRFSLEVRIFFKKIKKD